MARTEKLRNIGLKSTERLATIGVHTLADLEAVGAVETYRRLKATHGGISLNMLWAL